MRKLFILCFIFFVVSCKSQIHIKDLSNNFKELNYILARVYVEKPLQKELFDSSVFVKIFKISDSKNTPKAIFKETDESFDSYLISITPDGDYYTESKLYKILGLINPKVIEIKELEYPKVSINIEFGNYNKRKTQKFVLEGNK